MVNHKKWTAWRALLLAAFLGPSTSAFAQGSLTTGIPAKNLDGGLRTREVVIDGWQTPAHTGVTVGTSGIVFALTINSGGTAITSISQDVTGTAIAPPPYAAKLTIGLQKNSGNGLTFTCTSFSIIGQDQFGQQRTESFNSTVWGTSTATTTYAYERLLRVKASGCTSNIGTNASDILRMMPTKFVALPTPIRSKNDFIQMCQADGADPATWDCLTDLQMRSITIDTRAHTVDLAPTGYTLSDADIFRIRYRAPNW